MKLLFLIASFILSSCSFGQNFLDLKVDELLTQYGDKNEWQLVSSRPDYLSWMRVKDAEIGETSGIGFEMNNGLSKKVILVYNSESYQSVLSALDDDFIKIGNSLWITKDKRLAFDVVSDKLSTHRLFSVVIYRTTTDTQ